MVRSNLFEGLQGGDGDYGWCVVIEVALKVFQIIMNNLPIADGEGEGNGNDNQQKEEPQMNP